jgi:hypothetical protein
VEAKQRTLAYWLERAAEDGDLDAPLLTPEDIADHGRALRGDPEGSRVLGRRLGEPVPREALLAELNERLTYMRHRAEAGELVGPEGERIEGRALDALAPVEALPRHEGAEHRVVLETAPIHCSPRIEGLFTVPTDLAFDRNLCSTARAQEVVEILAEWPSGVKLARTRYVMGFLEAGARLSPPIPDALRAPLLRGPRAELLESTEITLEGGGEATLPAGTFLPLAAPSVDAAPAEQGTTPKSFLVAAADGFHRSAPLPEGSTLLTARPLTRRALLTEAFRYLGAPYGWGDRGGARDCSRYLLDVFASFGLELPRHSAHQAEAGTFVIDASEVSDPREKQRLIEAAARSGIVLLHFPGHIMLYLGETEAGAPMAIHAFSEYLVPCSTDPGGGETLRRVDRVEVSDLTLGAGSSRRSFLERITKIAVLGRPAKPELRGAATFRRSAPPAAPAVCEDSADAWIVSAPARPAPGEPLRIVVALSEDPAPATLAVYGPDGAPVPATITPLGGPPFGYVATVAAPAEGVHTAVFGDGARIVACERVAVRAGPKAATERAPGDPAWVDHWRWERDTENLYALFVEHLFRSPDGSTRTWTSLSEVLRDPERNLLYDYLGEREEERLRLVPDCADLSYVLRAYFAWKLRLPFAFRRCSRGRAGVAPSCGDEPSTNLEPVDAEDDVAAFQAFSRLVSNAVHSASARTLPTSDHSDHYPVALDRASLVPGTTFADPYGHVLLLAQWRPQGVTAHGALIGADAQPDGTVGQRIFWRGTFLFTPETTEVGAGFKAWRPIVTRRGERLVLDNDEIGRLGGVYAYSDEQYQGTADDFYDRMAELANPRALSPRGVMDSLVDALFESVQRRVISVQTGEDYMRAHPGLVVAMPEGHDVFETSGAWEDFATPSRDMRLLISIDAVLGFPGSVRRRPERFGVAPAEAEAVASALETALEEALAARDVTYARSNGEAQRLTLADVVARREAFELAYNPNDCVEVRWAAREGSDERTSCARHAPAAQRARMDEYRAWFRDRRRPPR